MNAHPCPFCRCGNLCGKDVLGWSDRKVYVHLGNSDEVVEAVLACVGDHVYDRTVSGVPYGIPTELREKLADVVGRVMDLGAPQWREHTVAPLPEALREELRTELLGVLAEHGPCAPPAP